MRNNYPLIFIEYGDGEGRVLYAIGWSVDDAPDTPYQIAGVLEPISNAEWVPGSIITIPTDAVISYRVIKTSLPKVMRQ